MVRKMRFASNKAITKIQSIILAVVIVVAAVAAGVYYYITLPPPTPTPSIPEKLIVTQIGAHWAIVKYGTDPATDGAVCAYMPLLYETLFTYDPIAEQEGTFKIIPWLAESYTVSPDGLTYTIKLREGVKFHSGNTMTADDVIYTYNRRWFYDWTPFVAMLPWPVFKFMPNNIVSFDKVDDYTVRINLNGTIVNFLEFLAGRHWAILDSEAVKTHEKTLPEFGNVKDYGATWLGYDCGDAGTGPYKVKKIEMTVLYEFERFDGYWGGPPELNLSKPQFKEISFIPINEDADARMKLLKGDVHIATDFLASTLLALQGSPEVKTRMVYSPYGDGLWMHTVNGPLRDWRVRKAIKMALNYTEIIDVGVGLGCAEVAQGFFMPGMPGWETNAGYFPGAQYEEANALLDELGYEVKEDGWRFRITMYLRPEPRYGMDFTKIGLVVRDNLAKVKIDAVPVVLHVSEYYAHAYTPEEECMWIQPFDTAIMPAAPTMLISYWGLGKAWYFGFNATTQPEIADKIAEMDALYEQAMAELSDEARTAIYQQMERLALEYGPWITIAPAKYYTASSTHLSEFWWGPKAIFPSIFLMKWT